MPWLAQPETVQVTFLLVQGEGCAWLTWDHRHLYLEDGVNIKWHIDPTLVRSRILLSEALQGHCEGEVCRMVSDGHVAPRHVSL